MLRFQKRTSALRRHHLRAILRGKRELNRLFAGGYALTSPEMLRAELAISSRCAALERLRRAGPDSGAVPED